PPEAEENGGEMATKNFDQVQRDGREEHLGAETTEAGYREGQVLAVHQPFVVALHRLLHLRLSFWDQPGLLDIVSNASIEAAYEDAATSSLGPSRAVSPAPETLSQAISMLWTEVSESPSMARSGNSALSSDAVDADSRADAFIANFWRHIQMEWQVSLELRYCKLNSLDSSASD
ncbi:hypothetical protein Taro_051919, partial [Colocasia esculenta]|nr:hypothetical protein [Colocasia esculenta]